MFAYPTCSSDTRLSSRKLASTTNYLTMTNYYPLQLAVLRHTVNCQPTSKVLQQIQGQLTLVPIVGDQHVALNNIVLDLLKKKACKKPTGTYLNHA
jgi:hypothetical protein